MSYNTHGLIRELVFHINRCSPELRVERRMPAVEGYTAVYLPNTLAEQLRQEADRLSKFEQECG